VTTSRKIASNRKALRDYEVLEHVEAGIELQGTEVKSIREGHIALTGAYARTEKGQIWLHSVSVLPYEYGNRFNHDPDRPKRLLLHKAEILRLQAQNEQKGCALVPLSVYFKKGRVKIDLGVCRGKRQADKRETLKRKTADREAQRAMAHFSSGKG